MNLEEEIEMKSKWLIDNAIFYFNEDGKYKFMGLEKEMELFISNYLMMGDSYFNSFYIKVKNSVRELQLEKLTQ